MIICEKTGKGQAYISAVASKGVGVFVMKHCIELACLAACGSFPFNLIAKLPSCSATKHAKHITMESWRGAALSAAASLRLGSSGASGHSVSAGRGDERGGWPSTAMTHCATRVDPATRLERRSGG